MCFARPRLIYLLLPMLLFGPPGAGAASARQADRSPAPDGAAIFATHCAMCHGDQGQGVTAVVSMAGPSLQAEHDHGMAMLAMEAGRPHMPTFAYLLSVAQMRAVADYVTTDLAVIPLQGGNLTEGGTLFRTYCSACHRTAVRGGGLVYAGTNAPALTGLSPAIIAGAIRMGPGPMPAFPASVLDDHQLASIVDYVGYAQHPERPGGNPLNWYGPVAEGLFGWCAVFALIGLTVWIERGEDG